MVYKWLQFAHSGLLRTVCRLCCAPGLPGLELCQDCRADLPWLDRSCAGCATPLPAGVTITLCARCQAAQPALDHCRALFEYTSPVDNWIVAMKFHQDLAGARLFGALLREQVPPVSGPPRPELVPVPLHRKRLAERGYNQSLEIARPLRKLGYRLDLDCCRRSRHTAAQSELPLTSRQANLRGAFSTNLPLDGRRFILIDDVLTTGATLNELAGTLKRAGAERVEAWVVARAVNKNST